MGTCASDMEKVRRNGVRQLPRGSKSNEHDVITHGAARSCRVPLVSGFLGNSLRQEGFIPCGDKQCIRYIQKIHLDQSLSSSICREARCQCAFSRRRGNKVTASATFRLAFVAAARVEDLPAGAKLNVDWLCLLADAFAAVVFFAGAFAGAFLVVWLQFVISRYCSPRTGSTRT